VSGVLHHSHMRLAAGLVLMALLLATAAGAQDAPVIRQVVVEGNAAFDHGRVLRIVRFGPGDKLWRTPEALAQALEDRYRSSGFVAARVTGAFEPATGTLRLVVDEGRLARVDVQGVDEATATSVRERLGLAPGAVLQEAELRKGLAQLTDESMGALEPERWPPYEVSHDAEGVALTVKLVARRFRLALVPGGGPSHPWNRLDGLAPWASLELTRYDQRRFLHTNVYVRGTYGFESERVRGAVGVRQPLFAGRRLWLGYEWHDLTDNDDGFRTSMFEEAPASTFARPATAGYYGRRGHEAYAFVTARPLLQLGLSFRADEYERLFDKSGDPDQRRRDLSRPGRSSSLIGTLRWARGGVLFASPRREVESLLLRDLYGMRFEPGNVIRFDATYEWASPDLGGDFDFSRLLVQLKGEHVASARVSLRGRLLAGLTAGDPPLQRRMTIGGVGTLRARPPSAIEGDHATVVNLEAAFTTWPRFPAVAAFYDGAVAWGEHSREHGWLSDVGVGLEWPAGRAFFIRVDGACALDPIGDDQRCRVSGRARIPF
jgi:hypothetical protein